MRNSFWHFAYMQCNKGMVQFHFHNLKYFIGYFPPVWLYFWTIPKDMKMIGHFGTTLPPIKPQTLRFCLQSCYFRSDNKCHHILQTKWNLFYNWWNSSCRETTIFFFFCMFLEYFCLGFDLIWFINVVTPLIVDVINRVRVRFISNIPPVLLFHHLSHVEKPSEWWSHPNALQVVN